MTTTETKLRIYVASLSDYNAGNLLGRWIDATQSADAIQDEIDALLRESKHPNVEVDCPRKTNHEITMRMGWCSAATMAGEPCPLCKGTGKVPSAEEWAIHDSEGFGDALKEHQDVETIAEIAELIQEHGDLFARVLSNFGGDVEEAKDAITENYAGVHRNLEDFAAGMLEETGAFVGASETLKRYFDYESYARDLKLGGDVWTIEMHDGVHVFWNH